jgi:hypothetical protein
MTDKLLREAAQNILNGIETGAIKIETDQDESWANALSALRSALAQSESEPDKLEKAARAIYDMMPFDGVGSEKKPAWQEGGNSLKQDEARRYGAAVVAVLKELQPMQTNTGYLPSWRITDLLAQINHGTN